MPLGDICLYIAIGGLLCQKEGQASYAIYFISKNLTPVELKYIVTEKEFLVVVYSINKFHHNITGYEFFVHTDHFPIIFLMNKPITNGRVTRWILLLQEFNIAFVDRAGRENLVPNFLCCIQHDDGAKPVDDTFLDEHLFFVSIQTPWFAYIANYLATGKLPNHLSPHEKHRIVIQSSSYSWVDNDILFIGPDLIIRRCVREDEMTEIFRAFHDGPCGGHLSDKRTPNDIQSIAFWLLMGKHF